MSDEQVTVYCCVLNEAASMSALLDSLLAQTRPPDEILVIDGGSSDGSLEILNGYVSGTSRLRVVVAGGTNIAEARNVAIREAKYELIASIDGGCVARPDWVQRLLESLAPDVDIVSGVYLADPQSDWERVMESFFYPDVSKLPEDWNEPAHCSVLVRKKVWKAVGPIPRNLYRSEDSWFNSQATRLGFRFRIARNAAIYREPRRTFQEVFKNTQLWVQSDIENGVNMPHRLHRAARIAFRLNGKVAALSLWLAAFLFSAGAGILTLPLALGALVKVTYDMKSVRYVVLYNAVDYLVMLASTLGFLNGCRRWVRRRDQSTGSKSDP